MNSREISAVDFYLGLAFLCFALGAKTCGNIALGIAAFGFVVETLAYWR